MGPELAALGHQQLYAEADADQRLSPGGKVLERGDEIETTQGRHRIPERPDTGKHHRIGALDGSAIRGDCGSQAHGPACLDHAEQVPQPVVDNRYLPAGASCPAHDEASHRHSMPA